MRHSGSLVESESLKSWRHSCTAPTCTQTSPILLKGTVQRDGSCQKFFSFDRSSLKREVRKVFKKKSTRPPSSESPLKYQSTSLFYNLQLGNQFRCMRWKFVAHFEYIFFFAVIYYHKYILITPSGTGQSWKDRFCAIYKRAEHSS